MIKRKGNKPQAPQQHHICGKKKGQAADEARKMGVLVKERHRFAQGKKSVQEKKPRENRRRRIVSSFGSLQDKNSTSSHYAQPHSPYQTLTPRTSQSPIFSLICRKHYNRQRKKEKKSLYYTKGRTKKKSRNSQDNPQRDPTQGHLQDNPGRVHLKKGNFQKLSLFRLKTYQKLESGNVALEEKHHLDYTHAPDKPHKGENHFGNHKEAKEPCVFKPHRDATSVTGGSGEERKTQDGRWYVN